MLWHVNELLLMLVVLSAFLGATEAGYRVGRRHAVRRDDSDKAHVAALHGASLGLLALLIGFTFFMAVSRFDSRKSLVLEEANAIGTTYLRSDFLPQAQREPVKALLRDYVAARLAFNAAGIDPARLEHADSEAARIGRQLWAAAVQATTQAHESEPTALFVESLNSVIDLHEKRQVALGDHVPEAVLFLLLVVSLASFGSLGYSCGLAQRRRFASNAIFALLIVFVLTTILDIDRPRRGVIKIPQQSLLRLQAALENDAR